MKLNKDRYFQNSERRIAKVITVYDFEYQVLK